MKLGRTARALLPLSLLPAAPVAMGCCHSEDRGGSGEGEGPPVLAQSDVTPSFVQQSPLQALFGAWGFAQGYDPFSPEVRP